MRKTIGPSHILTRLCLAGVVAAACEAPAPSPVDADAHLEEVERWRAYRYDLLHREGWLSLTGLHWLEGGSNTFGAAESNAIRFRGHGIPEYIGAFTLRDGEVSMRVVDGVTVLHDGTAIREAKLETDASPDTTVLSLGSLTWYVIERQGRYAIRVQDSLAPTLVDFDEIAAFPVNAGWRKVARFERYLPPKPIQVPNVLGTVNERASPGAVVFRIGRRTYRLDVVGEPADSAFWIQFGDQTNGVETYGGGRYIWVDAPTEKDETVLDFNRAYNPPCVFTPYATCPLPPRQNKLGLRVVAGELKYEPN